MRWGLLIVLLASQSWAQSSLRDVFQSLPVQEILSHGKSESNPSADRALYLSPLTAVRLRVDSTLGLIQIRDTSGQYLTEISFVQWNPSSSLPLALLTVHVDGAEENYDQFRLFRQDKGKWNDQTKLEFPSNTFPVVLLKSGKKIPVRSVYTIDPSSQSLRIDLLTLQDLSLNAQKLSESELVEYYRDYEKLPTKTLVFKLNPKTGHFEKQP